VTKAAATKAATRAVIEVFMALLQVHRPAWTT